jgi:hypothetical protein
MKNPTFHQFGALAGKVADVLRSNPSVDGDELQNAILSQDHPFWLKIAEAALTLISALKVLAIDYTLSLAYMVKSGGYDWVNPDITPENFPITGSGVEEVEYMLVHPNIYISSKDAISAIKAEDKNNSWQPAAIQHLLAFGAKNPEEQRKYPIVALGSVAQFHGFRRVACLFGVDVGRSLDLFDWAGDWDASFRFLAVRKVSKPLVS